MGYRLECYLKGKEKKQFCGGKLFGYKFELCCIEDEESFDEAYNSSPSFKYLVDKNYMEKNKYYDWNYGAYNTFEMKAEDFKEWIINYYIPEYIKCWEYNGWTIEWDENFLEGDTPVIVEWC